MEKATISKLILVSGTVLAAAVQVWVLGRARRNRLAREAAAEQEAGQPAAESNEGRKDA